jgi:hypothetical protein
MAMYRLLGAAAALALISAPGMTPALAQQVISEPGYCAFFYPNANCQNKGPGNPYTDPNYQYQRQYGQGYVVPDNGQTVGVVRRSARRSARMQ